MKASSMKHKFAFAAIALAAAIGWAGVCPAQAVTNFNVSTPGSQFAFLVNGVNNNPTLNLPAGATYTFSVSTTPGFHPMAIATETNSPFSDGFYSGATPQNISSGTVTLTIPSSGFPSTLYYICTFHGFNGVINVLPPAPPPAPPQNIIISIILSPTSVTLKSTGTNTTYNLVPEYNSNLVTGTWLSVPGFTNIFSSGTNTTSFGRLEPICGPDVFLRISQRPPQ
jgi:hypothetical protein